MSKEPDAELNDYLSFVDRVKSLKKEVHIALVGKYVELHDAYLSVREALRSAGYALDADVKIHWIKAMDVTKENVASLLQGCDGILVPGGFGERGSEGKKEAIRFARENKIPYLGICFGMQLAMIEFAENVLHLPEANTTEFNPNTPNPIVDFLHDQYSGIDMGGTLRLGAYDCAIKEGTLAYECYGKSLVRERHRHRYEFNNRYREMFEAAGVVFSGINPQQNLVEIVEIPDHPFFIASQFHPEFTSRPMRANPLFYGFIRASLMKKA